MNACDRVLFRVIMRKLHKNVGEYGLAYRLVVKNEMESFGYPVHDMNVEKSIQAIIRDPAISTAQKQADGFLLLRQMSTHSRLFALLSSL